MQNDVPQASGLTSAEAARRLAEQGPNEIAPPDSVSPLTVFFRQFTNLLIVILMFAAAAAAVLGETVDAIAITLVLVLNGVLGFVQEWRAETAIGRLREMLTTHARVVRDGQHMVIDTRQIVTGDLVVLESGDKVPADLDLTTALQLKVDESILTGESLPVEKTLSGEATRLFMGTSVVSGRAEGIVAATGARTEFGEIAALTGAVGEKTTHLAAQLGRLARLLGAVAVVIGAVIGLVGLAAGREPLEVFMTALALAVAMVPEGLPAVVTITLALGASAMLKQKALVRRLQSVDALGSASMICTDKTGTLTENAMTATRIWAGGRRYDVTGTGYDPAGHIAANGARCRASDDPLLAQLLDVSIRCNHADLRRRGDDWQMVGDPTEGALTTLAYKGWTPLPDPADTLSEIPFSSERKMMSVVTRTPDGPVLMTKGAPEPVLDRCAQWMTPDGPQPLDDAKRAEIRAEQDKMASAGQRVLGLAMRPAGQGEATEEDLIFLGLVGLIDPPRPEVRDAVRLCRQAGIRVAMITGDAPTTARAIAEEIGLPVSRFITGAELEEIDDDELHALVLDDVHFARTAPAHKIRIVRALQDEGLLVAMTGDGVNDAPALKQADIGVAMGQRGTDVAKDASDLVLLDDNFATIVRAIAEGRRQFSNIQKFVRYLLASNTGEVVAILGNLAMGGPLVFLPTQILWMNLVTDGATAVALGLEKASPEQMRRPPLPRHTPILGWPGMAMLACLGLYTGGAALWIFYSLLPLGEDIARTAAFTGMVVFEKASVFAFRSFTTSCTRLGWLSNRVLIIALVITLGLQVAAVNFGPLQLMLHTVPLGWAEWQTIGLLALPLIIVPEIVKMVRQPRHGAA